MQPQSVTYLFAPRLHGDAGFVYALRNGPAACAMCPVLLWVELAMLTDVKSSEAAGASTDSNSAAKSAITKSRGGA